MNQPDAHLARRLGLFDATMIVMGGIIGSGIFINPYVVAIIIAFSGRYEQILNYVVSSDVIFFALTAACVFAFRRRCRNPTVREGAEVRVNTGTLPDSRVSAGAFRIPGHPLTTLFFTFFTGCFYDPVATARGSDTR